MITPNPDPTSRYPNEYCTTCGAGWPEFVKCDKKSWDSGDLSACKFVGKVPMTAEMVQIASAFARGEIPAGTRRMHAKAESANVAPSLVACGVDWSTLTPPKG